MMRGVLATVWKTDGVFFHGVSLALHRGWVLQAPWTSFM